VLVRYWPLCSVFTDHRQDGGGFASPSFQEDAPVGRIAEGRKGMVGVGSVYWQLS